MDMLQSVFEIVAGFGAKVAGSLPLLALAAVVFTLIEGVARSKASKGPWWRKPELVTDLLYVFLVPGLLSYLKVGILVIGAALCAGVVGSKDAAAYLNEGHGFIAGLPFWGQVIVYLVATDIIMYWSHRIFHGPGLWRYHAIHHSPEHLDWISAFRFHPVNTLFHSVLADTVLLLAGVSPAVVVMLVPFQIFMSGFVHADVDWDLGPFKYVIASPVFHRWHHTDVARGGEMNFAPTFPIIDIIFGTFYMPKDAKPDAFGVDDPNFPKSIEGQMIYPFVKPADGDAPAQTAAAGR
jgi:sterol desaturase/sphingolipid hydroxylase (fatty acid hydroxylase superfamily)